MNLRLFHQYLLTASVVFIAVAGIVSSAGCGPKAPPPNAKDSVAQALTLGPENFIVVSQGRIQNGPPLSGNLRAKNQATMRAQIAGAVMQTYAEQGEHVGAGALLARLDDRAIRDAVTSAQAAVQNARSSLAIAEREQKRLETLKAAGAVAERDVESAQRNSVAAQAALSQAQSQLAAAQKQLAFTQVRAPFAGVVSAKSVSAGDIVQPGGAIYTVVQPSSMELQAAVPADQIALIKVGMPVQFTVTGYPDREFNGRVTRINPTADPVTRQVTVFAEIPNPGGTLVGDLFAEGRIATEQRTALVVPNSAIERKMMKPAVMKIDRGVVKRVEVTLGINDPQSGRVEVTSGIIAGDTLLSGPAMQISEGTHIRATGPAATPTAAQTRQTP